MSCDRSLPVAARTRASDTSRARQEAVPRDSLYAGASPIRVTLRCVRNASEWSAKRGYRAEQDKNLRACDENRPAKGKSLLTSMAEPAKMHLQVIGQERETREISTAR